MKLWKRVYLITLVIITLIVNIGFLGITFFTYNQMLEEERDRCSSEFVVLLENISADIADMERSKELNQQYFRAFVRSYADYYENDTKLIGVVAGDIVTTSEEDENLPYSDGIYIEDEGNTTIYISRILDEEHTDYRIVMRRTLYSFDEMWDTLTPIYIVGGVILSLGTSAFLAFVVRFLLKPMDKLEEAAKQVEQENWSARVDIHGNSELAKLGRQFNAMASAVEDNVMKLEEQAGQKQELINNLAHEMNTPITSIQGFADYIRISKLSDEEKEECLEFIIDESKRMKNISSTLLSMAKIDNNEGVEMTGFSIKKLCDRLQNIYRKQCDMQGVQLTVNCQVEDMYGNEALIESLLRNLINNGYHAVNGVENGHISVSIISKQHTLYIKVADNGCGIDKSHREQIFEPFYRVDKARSREQGGSGLGLPFCRRIVKLHNGTIEVNSELQRGTTFLISLPFDNFSENI